MVNDCKLNAYTKLIIQSGEELFSYIYDKQGKDLYDWILPYLTDKNSSFHLSYITDVSKDDIVQGMVLTLPVKTLNENSIKEIGIIFKNIKGVKNSFKYLIKLISRMKVVKYYPKLKNDEFFISNIAVFPEFQGKNVGSELLLLAENKARSLGFNKISLFVEIDNIKAQKFYEKNNYIMESKLEFPKEYSAFHIYGFYKMIKTIR